MKRVLRILPWLVVLGLLVWGYYRLQDPIDFPVETVKIAGVYPHENQSIVEQVITPYAKQGLFGLSARELREALQQLPWVQTANIRRVWRATLEVTLSEKQPVAIWNHQQFLALNQTLFTPNKPSEMLDYATLPQLNGPDNQAIMMYEALQKMNGLLEPLGFSVQNLELSPRHSWSAVLNNQTQLVLGQNDIWNKLQNFIAVYPKTLADKANRVALVDLRYPNGFAVQWKKR